MNNPLQKTSTVKKQEIENVFKKMHAQFLQAMPKSMDYERFMRIALNATNNTPKLLDCDRKSFFVAVMKSAQLGLEPDGLLGQAYLIPYKDTVTLQIGYKGYITIANRAGVTISASAVYQNDDIELSFFGQSRFNRCVRGDRGNLIGFIAKAEFKDLSPTIIEYMSIEEVNKIRDNHSKGGNIWQNHYEEMGKKTAIRRLVKYLPLSVQVAEKTESLQDAGVNFSIKEGGIVLDDMQDVTPQEDASIQPTITPIATQSSPRPNPTQVELGETSDYLINYPT